jgi:hypothetical protein
MGQLDRDMNAKQLEEARRDLQYLQSLPVNEVHSSVKAGSVVRTDKQLFFISLGLGTLNLNGESYILLSTNAPMTKMLEGKKVGDTIDFRGIPSRIKEVY